MGYGVAGGAQRQQFALGGVLPAGSIEKVMGLKLSRSTASRASVARKVDALMP
jgi:hypothetical protein